jgi:hypothetical protein
MDRVDPRVLVPGRGNWKPWFGMPVPRGRSGGGLWAVLAASGRFPRTLTTRSGGFGCPVFDHYGLTETGSGRGECAAGPGITWPRPTFFSRSWTRDGGSPAAGRTRGGVTTLGRQGMPLVRYRTGELG